MRTRTFYRRTLEIFLNNPIVKTIEALVNFCNETRYYNRKELKFLQKMPLNNIVKDNYYKNRFIFNSTITDRTGFK